MTRRIMVAGNWKMNNSVEEGVRLAEGVAREARNVTSVDIVLAPPFTALKPVYDCLSDSSIQVAAQNVHHEESGAYTGEISPMMLKEAGCKWVIIGHSERRQLFGETDESVNKKVKAAREKGGLKVILCIGETLDERESGETFAVLDRQLKGGLEGLNEVQMASLILAYEPVWAIGTGKTATPDQADEAHHHIRDYVHSLYGEKVAEATRILYGGSVKPANAAELFGREHIDGGLIGGASLKLSDFYAIIAAGVLSE